MKITKVETYFVHAGWRPWSFIKVSTDAGIVGWSECTESFGSPRALPAVVEDLSSIVVGQDPFAIEKLYWEMYLRTRQSRGGVVHKAIAGITNALFDVKARALNVPVYELLGGAIRDSFPVYWSHCVTTRIRSSNHLKGVAPIQTLADLKPLGEEIRRSGFTAVKSNLAVFDEKPWVYHPGFARSPGGPAMNPDRRIISKVREYFLALREAVGSDIQIMADANYNFQPEGYVALAEALEDVHLHWLEFDLDDPRGLREVKQRIKTPICSLENLLTAREYLPFLAERAVDVAAIDVTWNGLIDAKRIADLAQLHSTNVSVHNHYSHLSTYMAAQFCAVIPNFRIMELDVDDIPLRETLVSRPPEIVQGVLRLPTGPGWGVEMNEEVMKAHPWTF